MLNIFLVRPGATDFDEQGRIKGSLDMPLSESGQCQVQQTVAELASVELQAVYSAPCESARKTTELLTTGRTVKQKVIDSFQNLDHGLWHGKLVDEVRRQQPRLYQQGKEDPESICPPGGETIEQAKQRVIKSLEKILKKHRSGAIALVIPEPLATVVHCLLSGDALKSFWESELDRGVWELIELSSTGVASSAGSGA